MSAQPTRYFPRDPSPNVTHYQMEFGTVYVFYRDGRKEPSVTLPDRDSLKRAVLCGALTKTSPLDHLRQTLSL